MIIAIVLGGLALLLTILVLIQLIGYRFRKNYIQHARDKGLKVYQHPYAFVGSSAYKEMKRQQLAYNDANYIYKTVIPNYDIAISNIMQNTMVELVDLDIIKQFYIKESEGYYIKRNLGFAEISRLLTYDNVLLSEGAHWKNRRKLLSSVFNYDFIKAQIPQIQSIFRNKLNQMEAMHQTSEGVYTYDVTNSLIHSFSMVILQCFFRTEASKKIDGVDMIDFANKLVASIGTSARKPLSLLMGPKLTRLGFRKVDRQIQEDIGKFRTTAESLIRERIEHIKAHPSAGKQPADIVEALIKDGRLKEQSNGGDMEITINTLINELGVFLVAGSETTMAFTRMMIYRLAQHPEVLSKVRQEIAEHITEDELTYDSLKKLKYFQCAQKEVLRMDSSISMIFPRVALKDHYLGSLKIYKGMNLGPRLRSVHFSSKEYDRPLQFLPERWLQESATSNPFSYIPFSAGARNCIGSHLSLLENKIMMVQLIRRYKSISIDKKEIRMVFTLLYGPEPVLTTFSKYA